MIVRQCHNREFVVKANNFTFIPRFYSISLTLSATQISTILSKSAGA
jgi:hypothetical protein